MDYFRQMISSFLNTNRVSIFLLALLVFGCQEKVQKDQPSKNSVTSNLVSDTLFAQCNTEACSLFTFSKKGEKIFLEETSRSTSVKRLNTHTFAAHSSCGNPCSETFYYDTESGKKGGPFLDVVAVDTTNFLVAHMDSASVSVECMFPCNNKPFIVHPAISTVAAPVAAITKARFENSSLIFTYLHGPNFEGVVDTLLLPKIY